MIPQPENKTPRRIAFAAIDPYLERTLPSPKETKVPGREFVEWGDRNLYPYYLLELYDTVPTLRSIVNGNVDFITGDDCSILPLTETMKGGRMNTHGDTIRDQVKDIARDFEIYGGFALQVIRNYAGEVAEVYYIDIRFLRTNEDCTVFRYSEKWDKGGRRDVSVYPAFIPFTPEKWAGLSEEERDRHASSIVYVKNEHTQTYPAPIYAASIKDCEIERNITDYHYNSLENGFASSVIINFNNGIPSDEMQEEIVADIASKFTGHQNGSRFICSWNRTKENATTIEPLKVEDFGERYKALSTHARQQIFSAFRAIPALFGIMTESTGFNEQEFEQAFRLYNRTQVRPVQRLICDTYDRIYGEPGVLTIKPFSLEDEAEQNVQ